jgi:hypothetical protein
MRCSLCPCRYCGEIEVRAEHRKDPHWKRALPPTNEVLSLVEAFLDARTLGACAIVNTQWREMSEMAPQYYDLKHMEPFANFEAHDGKIEDLFVYVRASKKEMLCGGSWCERSEQEGDALRRIRATE